MLYTSSVGLSLCGSNHTRAHFRDTGRDWGWVRDVGSHDDLTQRDMHAKVWSNKLYIQADRNLRTRPRRLTISLFIQSKANHMIWRVAVDTQSTSRGNLMVLNHFFTLSNKTLFTEVYLAITASLRASFIITPGKLVAAAVFILLFRWETSYYS